jgi:hypothetical protein
MIGAGEQRSNSRNADDYALSGMPGGAVKEGFISLINRRNGTSQAGLSWTAPGLQSCPPLFSSLAEWF